MIVTLLKTHRLICTSILGSMFAAGCLSLAGDAPPPEALRERAQVLQREIRELRANGHNEEAERLQMELRELRGQAGRVQREAMQPERDRALPPEAVRERREIMRRIRELMAEGREDEAAALKEELARRQRELGGRPGGPGIPVRPDVPARRLEMEQRLQHLEIAIENLHAAGLHDVADRLAEEAGHQREQMDAPRGPEPPIARLGEELDRMRAELEELRGNLRELREHIAQLHRDR